MMIMELEGGIKASYLQCHFTPDYHRNYTFIGTEGRIENSEPEMKVWVKTRALAAAGAIWPTAPTTSSRRRAGTAAPTRSSAGTSWTWCLDGKEPLAPPLAGRMSVAAGVCAANSLRNGGMPVDVPPPPAWLG